MFPYAVRSKDPKIKKLVKSLQDQIKAKGLWALLPTEYLPHKREAAWKKLQPRFDADPDLLVLAEGYKRYFANR